MLSSEDLKYLRQAVDLATMALEKGEKPFGALLVSKNGQVLFADHNHVKHGDYTRHPEFEIAKWSMLNLTLDERREATVYTSAEHCPMCAAAHGWAKLGRIVYASSTKQLIEWFKQLGIRPGHVKPLAIKEVLSQTKVDGPALEFKDEIFKLHKAYYNKFSENAK